MMPKRDPFREMEQLFNRMRREMGPPLSAGRRLELPFNDPFTLDLNEVDGAYELLADLPGYQRDDITLTTDGDRKLTIRVEAEDSAEDDQDTALHRGRRRASASRTVTLPEDANPEEASADYTNGVLTITVPREEDTGEDTVEIDIE